MLTLHILFGVVLPEVDFEAKPMSIIIPKLQKIIPELAASVYTIELLVRWYVGFSLYWHDKLCVLEFVMTMPTILGRCIEPKFKIFEFIIILRGQLSKLTCGKLVNL